jgi:hypothetical protein
MNKIYYFLLLTVFGILIINCGPSIKAGYDYDTEENFARFKTYDYLTQPENTQMSELVLKRVKQAIDNELEMKGLNQMSENPDLLIAIHTNVRSKVQVGTWGYSYSPYVVYWSSYGYYGTYGLQTREFQKGTLVVDFVESGAREMIWRGVAEGSIPEIPRSEQIEKLVNKAVKEMMKNYPPPLPKDK